MALQNGVLVHGPTSWAAAVRDENGELHVASGKKPRFGDSVDTPMLRGPLRLAEAFALLPMVRRALPQARFPFARPAVVGSIVASSLVARGLRRSTLSPGGRKSLPARFRSCRQCSLFGDRASPSITALSMSPSGRENDARAPKEHPRCGSQLIAPMLASSLAANVAAAGLRRPREASRAFSGPRPPSEPPSRSSRGRPESGEPPRELWLGPGSSCNAASPRRSRRTHRSRSQMRLETPASPSSSNTLIRGAYDFTADSS